MSEKVLLAVNGTLMRDFKLHKNLKEVKATFVKESQTEKGYRLYSINDQYPAMIKDEDGESIAVEVYELTTDAMEKVLAKEPEGLSIEPIKLIDDQEVFGVVGSPEIIEGQKDITSFKGWRKYMDHLHPVRKFKPLIVRGSIFLGLILLLVILSILKTNSDIAEGMSRTVSRYFVSFMGSISGILPFVSLTELLFIALFGGTVAFIVFFIINLVKKKPIRAFSKILNIAIMVISVIDAYHLSCEAAYNRKPAPLPYYQYQVEREDYIKIYNYYATDINLCAEQLEFKTNGDVKTNMSIWDIAKEVKKAYAILDDSYYSPNFGAVKPMMSSFIQYLLLLG